MRKKKSSKKFKLNIKFLAVGLAAMVIVLFFNADLILKQAVKAANLISNCSLPIANTTFIKSYRLLTFTKVNGAWPTKDGGYIISGTTDPNIMFIPPDGFVAKLDKQGSVKWLKFLKTTNAPGDGNRLGDEDVQSIIELKAGGYLMVSKVWGFIKSAEWQADKVELNKILFTKLDKNGNPLWHKSFTAKAEDIKNSLIETIDGGFLFYGNTTDLTPDKIGEDSDVYYDLPYSSLKVIKFDKNGNVGWSKNITNFIARKSDSYLIATPDGGYALAGNITETNAEKKLPYNFDAYPGLAKFDKDFNFKWAKSMEGTPLEMAAAIPKAGGGYEMGWKKVRQGAINVRGLTRTQDNGYLILGQWSGGLSLMSNSLDLKSGAKSYLIAFKFNSAGEMDWVKKLTLSYNEFTSPMTEFSVSLTADKKIMMVGPITWADEDYRAKTKAVTEKRNWYAAKYGEAEMGKEDSEKSKQSLADWKKVKAVIKIAQDAFRPAIFMAKWDDNLNAVWAKIINPERGATNYILKPTADSGTIIAGEHVSKDIKSAILDSITYYKDGFLMKLDASGNINNNKNWLVDYNGSIITELMTAYSVSNNLSVKLKSYKVNLTKRAPEFSLYKKAKTFTFAPFLSAKTTACAKPPAAASSGVPLGNSTSVSTGAKTWPQINYEKAASVEPVNDKSRSIHNELLPALNKLYNNEIKLTDNLGGSMLSYVFSRVITKDDVAAVKASLEGFGYKTQDEGAYQLTMYKPGYFLVMTFSVGNLNKAFLNITY
ncbi:MAG: hypothetical protein PHF50_01335 [Patescibacteria group bacterium]|nr:hypothetical protein [Patescibacteria group bacterium]